MNDATAAQVGDRVILRGTIVALHEGVALVEVDRTDPLSDRIAVQCGALELDALWCKGSTCPSGPCLHWRTDSCTSVPSFADDPFYGVEVRNLTHPEIS